MPSRKLSAGRSLAHLLRNLTTPHPQAILTLPAGRAPISLSVHRNGEHVSKKMMSVGEWEPTETRCVCELLGAGDFVVDVGANIGYYGVLFGRLVGDAGRVICIEPDAANFRLLRRNLRRNNLNNVKTLQALAGAVGGFGSLYRSASNYGDHRAYPSEDQDVGTEQKMISLDGVIAAEGRAPKLIKLDCQGAEIEIMRGLANSFASDAMQPRTLIVEYWPFGLSESGAQARDLVELIPDAYEMWDIGRWKGLPKRTNREQLIRLAQTELAPSSRLFTNVLLARSVDKDLVASVDSLCRSC